LGHQAIIMLNIILLFASLVLVLAAGLMLKPVPAPAGALPVWPLIRLAVAAVLLSVLLVAVLMAAYSVNPARLRWAVARPVCRLLSDYPWVAFAGVALYGIMRLCGVKHRRSLWLFCLSLPGVLTMPMTFVAASILGVDRFDEVTFELLAHPATWILPIIVIRQWFWLGSPRDIHTLAALAQTLLIVAAYIALVRLPWP
jgi:hypothetical protein